MNDYFFIQILVIAIIEPMLIALCITFFVFGDRFPIKNRTPVLLHISNILLVLYFPILIMGRNSPIPCGPYLWVVSMAYPSLTTAALMRYVRSYSQYRVQLSLMNKDKRNRIYLWLAKQRFITVLWISTNLIFVAAYVLLGSLEYHNEYFAFKCVGDCQASACSSTGYQAIIFANVLLWFICITIAIILFWKLTVKLYIQTEIRALGIGITIIVICTVLRIVLTMPDETSIMFDGAVVLVVLALVYVTTTPYLIYKSIRIKNEFPEIVTREIRTKSEGGETTGSEDDATGVELNTKRLTRAPSLELFLRDPNERTQFKKFLSQEFCAENIQFWEAVNQFKLMDPDQRALAANKIIKQFIGSKARTPINIPGASIEKILKAIEDQPIPNEDFFDEAKRQVLDLLHQGEFRRFLTLRNSKSSANATENPIESV